MRAARRWAVLALALAALPAVAGCGGPAAGRPSADVTGPYGEPLITVPGDVRTAYLAYWDDWQQVARAADLRAAPLAAHAGEPNLSVLGASVEQLRTTGQRMHGEVRHRLIGMRVLGDYYQLYDCVDLDGWVIVDAAGAPVDQVGHRPEQLSVMTVRRQDGTWKVTDIQQPLPCPTAADRSAAPE
ncbi:hypothetical protein [Kitasatospora sp. NPDC004272]